MTKLAIEGGTPIRAVPMPPRIMFGAGERDAALRVIDKSMTGNQAFDRYGGVEVDAYEQEFAAYFGTKFATAVSSGTAAVHTALASLMLEPGSEVLTSPITDPGAVMPIVFQQCIPVFVDVEYDTLNPSPEAIEQAITGKTRAIIAVHLAGQPAKIEEIMEIAKKYGISVIEDCAQSHGVKYRGKFAGSFGDLSAFSLMSGKHTTSGGQGGMVLTGDEELYWNAKRFGDRGKPFNSTEGSNLFPGLNYRMTEIEAAIGRVQFAKIADIAAKRRAIYASLAKGFASRLKAFRLWKTIEGAEPNPWFCFVHVEKNLLTEENTKLAEALRAEGIPAGAHYVTPMYQQKWIAEKITFGTSGLPWTLPGARTIHYEGSCPNAEKALADHMTLPIHECWTNTEVEDTLQAFEKVEARYLK